MKAENMSLCLSSMISELRKSERVQTQQLIFVEWMNEWGLNWYRNIFNCLPSQKESQFQIFFEKPFVNLHGPRFCSLFSFFLIWKLFSDKLVLNPSPWDLEAAELSQWQWPGRGCGTGKGSTNSLQGLPYTTYPCTTSQPFLSWLPALLTWPPGDNANLGEAKGRGAWLLLPQMTLVRSKCLGTSEDAPAPRAWWSFILWRTVLPLAERAKG